MSRLCVVLLVTLMLLVAAAIWQLQAWRYGRQLAEQARLYAQERLQQADAASRELLEQRQQRHVLEQQIQATDQSHYQELLDAQQAQVRLRDRLATADLRLSVLLAATPGSGMPATSGSGSLDDGAPRAELDSAHARRVIAITDEGDQGLIALRACQAYVRALQR